jgi:hypothetical protein
MTVKLKTQMTFDSGYQSRDCYYHLNASAEELLPIVIANTGVPVAKNQRLLLCKDDKTYVWIGPNQTLKQHEAKDGCA